MLVIACVLVVREFGSDPGSEVGKKPDEGLRFWFQEGFALRDVRGRDGSRGYSPHTLFSGGIPPLLFSLFACSSGFILSVLGRIRPGSRCLYFGVRRPRSTPWDGQVGGVEVTSHPSFIPPSYQWRLFL